MLRLLLLIFAMCVAAVRLEAAPMPLTALETAGLFQERKLATPVAGANEHYRLLPPVTVEKGKQYPLVVYLHGAGEKGDDNRKPLNSTLPRLLATDEWRRKFPCYVLVPQCRAGNRSDGYPNNWIRWDGMVGKKPVFWVSASAEPTNQLSSVLAAIDEIAKAEPIDAGRIYLTGTSMGGAGCWYLASHAPQRFAAVMPVCGLSDITRAARLASVPVWAFHGELDDQVPTQRTRDTIEALKKAGASPRYTEFAGAGHSVDKRVWTEETLTWLFEQKKPSTASPATKPINP